MKKVKAFYIRTLAGLFILMAIVSCERFSLLTDVKVEHIPAGQNLLTMTIWEFISENNFHVNDSTNVGLYGKAIQRAGLDELLNQTDANWTVIIPRNNSLLTFINSIGYSSVDEVPSIVLKNLLSNTIIDTRVKSYDLGIGETHAYLSLSEDSLYLRRTASQYDEYILTVNASSTSNSPSTSVRTQNLEFKNGIAHVVDNFTYYIAKVNFPDPVDETAVGSLSDTVFVSKDTYIQGGNSKNINYGTASETYTKLYPTSGSNVHYSRRILTQYAVRQPKFDVPIGSVKLEMYFNNISGTGYLNFYEEENIDFNEFTVTWENAPLPGVIPITGFEAVVSMRNNWQKIDISSTYMSAINEGKKIINIAGAATADHTIGFRTKEYDGGKYKSRIVMYSPVQTILYPGKINPIEVKREKGVSSLTLNELSFGGTSSKNIFYTLKSFPGKGYLVINSIPASINSSFTQEQIERGCVKYLYDGSNAMDNDTFILEARDYQGGIYELAVNMTVNIQ